MKPRIDFYRVEASLAKLFMTNKGGGDQSLPVRERCVEDERIHAMNHFTLCVVLKRRQQGGWDWTNLHFDRDLWELSERNSSLVPLFISWEVFISNGFYREKNLPNLLDKNLILPIHHSQIFKIQTEKHLLSSNVLLLLGVHHLSWYTFLRRLTKETRSGSWNVVNNRES